MSKLTATYGTNQVDWESRLDMSRLRTERLARLKAELERSDLAQPARRDAISSADLIDHCSIDPFTNARFHGKCTSAASTPGYPYD